MGAQNFCNSDNQVLLLKGMGRRLQHANTKYRFDHFPLLVTLPMESPVLVQEQFAWDRDDIMRALNCDYTKRALVFEGC